MAQIKISEKDFKENLEPHIKQENVEKVVDKNENVCYNEYNKSDKEEVNNMNNNKTNLGNIAKKVWKGFCTVGLTLIIAITVLVLIVTMQEVYNKSQEEQTKREMIKAGINPQEEVADEEHHTTSEEVEETKEIVQEVTEDNVIDDRAIQSAPRTENEGVEVIEALYFDYLMIECANGNEYIMSETGNWFDADGKVIFNDGEAYTAVIVDGEVVALF